jgi:hypothetical protein
MFDLFSECSDFTITANDALEGYSIPMSYTDFADFTERAGSLQNLPRSSV